MCGCSDSVASTGEYMKHPCMIMGHNPLNVVDDLDLRGATSLSTMFYIPNAIVPLTESKVALEQAYAEPLAVWDVNGLVLRPKGRPELEVIQFDVQDDSSTAKSDKLSGTSSDNVRQRSVSVVLMACGSVLPVLHMPPCDMASWSLLIV